jgi:hypothetical protein
MGAWTEIVDYTVPSNTTSVVLNDFGTITKDDFIKINFTIANSSTTNNLSVALFPNDSTTTSHYHRQLLFSSGTSVGATRANTNRPFASFVGTPGSEFAFLKLSENDRLNVFTNRTLNNNNNLETTFEYVTSSGVTFTSGITSLTFTGSLTDGIGTGSRIQIYRLDAEKVADITTTSNQTQVDISSLSIGKDSEYLLVADVKEGATSGAMDLYINDDTTATNYYRQLIQAFGSSTGANRTNSAEASTIVNQTISYTHIKLSEIGAYTFQNYSLRDYGSANIILDNRFGSSTSETITSITKLNIKAATNGIGSGTRFLLYKLK